MYEKKEEGLGDHNYCRGAKYGALWCYTTNPKKNWDYCDPISKEEVDKMISELPSAEDLALLKAKEAAEKAAKEEAEAEAKLKAFEKKIAEMIQMMKLAAAAHAAAEKEADK